MQQNVSMEDFDVTVCECGNDAFAQYYKIYRLSALKSPSGKEVLQAAPIYACAACGKVFNIQDEDKKSVLE